MRRWGIARIAICPIIAATATAGRTISTQPLPLAHTERNAGIDALRGVAILLVIFNHIGIRIPLAKTALTALVPTWLLRCLNYNGYEAVVIFFVISGFLITRRSQLRWGPLRDFDVRAFYVMRAARILPSLLLIVALLSVFDMLHVNQYVIEKSNQSLGGAVLAALGFYLNHYEAMTGYLPGGWDVLWSLSIEEVFYLVFPLVCITLGRWPTLLVVALIVFVASAPIVLGFIGDNDIAREKAYFPNMSAIAVGVLCALLVRRFEIPPAKSALVLICVGTFGLLGVIFAGSSVWRMVGNGYSLVVMAAAACLVIGLHWHASSVDAMPMRGFGWLRSCGRLSYEIYLMHMFCVFGVIAIARTGMLDAAWGFLWYAPAILLAWLLGLAIARGFSQPLDRTIRRRLLQRAG